MAKALPLILANIMAPKKNLISTFFWGGAMDIDRYRSFHQSQVYKLSFWLPGHPTFQPSMHQCPLRSDQCRQRPWNLENDAGKAPWDEGYMFIPT